MPDRPDQLRAGSEHRELVAAKATIEFILDAIKGDRFKDAMGHTAEWYVGHALGTTGYAYHVQGFCDVSAEAERYRKALEAVQRTRFSSDIHELTAAWTLADEALDA